MKIVLGADHGGFRLKQEIRKFLEQHGYEVVDKGTNSEDSVDYPDFAEAVGKEVAKGDAMGILFCRSAAGVVMAANKIHGIRAVAAFDERSAEHSREHNDANVLGLSGDWLTAQQAKDIVQTWLETAFPGEERHARRIQKMMALEKC